jgi:hypothetical protein
MERRARSSLKKAVEAISYLHRSHHAMLYEVLLAQPKQNRRNLGSHFFLHAAVNHEFHCRPAP